MIGNGNKDEDGMVVMFSSIVGFYEIESDVNDFLLGHDFRLHSCAFHLPVVCILGLLPCSLSILDKKTRHLIRSLLRIGYSSLNTREVLSVMSNKGFDSYHRNDVVFVPDLRASTLNDVVLAPDLRASPN
nr:hypothetical protein Iba_chr12bCG7600 [Ipomoea batatas]